MEEITITPEMEPFGEHLIFIRHLPEQEAEWYCVLCNTTHESKAEVQAHLQTDMHKNQVARLSATDRPIDNKMLESLLPQVKEQEPESNRVSGRPEADESGPRKTIRLFANYQMVHHEIVDENLVFGVTASTMFIPEVKLREANEADVFVTRLASYIEGGDV